MEEEVLKASAIITPNMMYASITELSSKVQHLTSVMDPALSEIRTDIADVRADIAKNEGRIEVLTVRMHTLSNRVFLQTGAAAVAGAIGGYIINSLYGG